MLSFGPTDESPFDQLRRRQRPRSVCPWPFGFMSNNRLTQASSSTRAYVALIVVAGAVTVAKSFYDLISQDTAWNWVILAVLTLVSGSATVRLPSLPATISVSETFVFTSVLLFGAPAGTLTVALDGLVISFWSYRKGHPLYKIVFNMSALPLTIWIAAQIFFLFPDMAPLFHATQPPDIGTLLAPLLTLAAVYFLLNSWIITFAIALEKRLEPYRVWRENFVWLSLNYFGGASVAALLVTYTRDLDYTYLVLILPLLVVLYFTFSMSMGRVADANKHLTQLNTLYMSTIETLAMAIDAKDQITHGHIRRVQAYAIGLAQKMGVTDPAQIRAVEAAALLHDMGKLAVPEYILNKPGPLTPAEFEKMKLHASVGADILSAIDFPYPVVPIVRHHHENWDGTGYPDGLAGADIPIGARILSVVDCFDALTSDRPYRPRLSDKEALKILSDRRGQMYDPLIVDTFVTVHAEIAPDASTLAHSTILHAIADASTHSTTPQRSVRRLDDIAASTEEMLTLFDLARGLTPQMSVQDAGDVIAKHLRRLVPCSICIFFIYDADADELIARHAAGDSASLLSDLRIGLGQRLSGWVAANRQTIRNSDPVLDFGEAARAMSPRPRSCLSTPLLEDGTLVGVLSLYSTTRDAFSDEHERVVEVVATQVAPIFRQAIQFDRTKAIALRDQLTGLPNTEHLRQLTSGQLGGGELRSNTSLLLIDVDNLSELNRKFGRRVGDDIVAAIVSATRRSLRAGDFLFRFGSDELVALLLQTDAATREVIADRIRDSIKNEPISQSTSSFSATVCGASAPEDGRTIDALLDAAARNLPNMQKRTRGPRGQGPPDSIH